MLSLKGNFSILYKDSRCPLEESTLINSVGSEQDSFALKLFSCCTTVLLQTFLAYFCFTLFNTL